jgi:glycosyltransferase involved in cell wall biosynthesis
MPTAILVIIPCFNEASSLPSLLNLLEQLNVQPSFSVDIVVINDCSTDNTIEVAKKQAKMVLDLPVNLGIGGAMQTGYRYAFENNYDLAIQMDGDGQHPPAELNKLLTCWQQTNADIIIGSRFLDHKGFQSSFLRRSGILYLSWLNKLLTGNWVHDTTSGYRLFNKKAIALAASDYPDEYPEPESLVIFSKKGLSIKETSVLMKERQGGTSSIKHFTQLYYLLKVTIAMFYSFIRK